MAKLFGVHGNFSAGISGEHFDIAAGYALSYTAPATDCTFAAAGKTLTLVSGTWPLWIREVGKEFVISGSALNNSTFHTASIDVTNKILTVAEIPVDEASQSVVADGSVDTKLIDVLLKSGNGVLTVDCPLTLKSTGALGGARTLSIAALEVESVAQGSQPLNGRPLIVSVRNSDISAVNSITVSSSATINGAASFVASKAGDYIFWHEEAGAWRVNVLSNPQEPHATIAEIPFTAADWNAGVLNQIKVLQTGVAATGEVGPHNLKVAQSYSVSVTNIDLSPRAEIEDVEVQFDKSPNGDVYLLKAQKAKPFNGIVTIIGSL